MVFKYYFNPIGTNYLQNPLLHLSQPFDFTEVQYFNKLRTASFSDTKVRKIVLPEGTIECDFYGCTCVEYVDYPTTYSKKGNADWSLRNMQSSKRILILRSEVKVENLRGENAFTDIYVPDHLVRVYKAEDLFYNKKIYPLSALKTNYRK